MVENGWNTVFEDTDAVCSVLMDEGKPVRVSMTCTDEIPCPWTNAEIEDQIAVLYGVWCRLGEWGQAEGDQIVAYVAVREDAQPTHRIDFVAPDGQTEVEIVYLYPDEDDGCQSAYTLAEWRGETGAAWGIVRGMWTCEGQVTPGGRNGTVTVTTL